MIRIGLVGCGFIGAVHSLTLKALCASGLVDATVVGVCDQERARADHFAGGHREARVFADVDELIDAVDALWVCTWTAAHRPAVEAAAAAGVAVFCEKPLAPNWPEAQAVAQAASAVPNQVGLVLRHAPVFTAFATAVASGSYGRPMVAVLRDDQYFPDRGQYGSTWRADATLSGGGALVEHSIHDVDVLEWILGPTSSVAATSGTFAGHPGIEDVVVVSGEHASGARSSLVSVWHGVLSRPSTRRLEVFCEHAMLWTDNDFCGPMHVETSAGHEVVSGAPPVWVDDLRLPAALATGLMPYAAPNRAFLDALATGSPPFPGVAVALAAHRVVDAAYRSAAAGGVPVGSGAG